MMSDKTKRIVFLISTGILTVIMTFSVGMYFLNHEMIAGAFSQLGYPTYLIYPLAIAKILGLIAIWTNRSRVLREWAYAGFFFDTTLAFTAHVMVEDGGQYMALVAFLALMASFFTRRD